MTAGAWTLTTAALKKIADGTFDLDSDTFKVALLQSTSNIGASSDLFSGVTNEVANGSGYTTGGVTVSPLTVSAANPSVVSFGTNPSWTASGGSIVARYACLYESGGSVLAYCLLDNTPADVTITDGTQFTITPHANGVLRLSA